MEAKKHAFVIDTTSTCFLCLKDFDSETESDCPKLFSVKMLSRYLNINPQTISGSTVPARLDNVQLEPLVSTCSTCLEALVMFGNNYLELEKAKLKICASLNKIQDIIIKSQRSTSKTGNNCKTSNFAENFRCKITSKSAAKLKGFTPKVRLEKINANLLMKSHGRYYLNSTSTQASQLFQLPKGRETAPKASLGHVYVKCKHCRQSLAKHYMPNHVISVHVEECFSGQRLPHVSKEEYKEVCQNVMDEETAVTATDDTGKSFQCRHCPLLIQGHQPKRKLKFHLVRRHFSIMAKKITGSQNKITGSQNNITGSQNKIISNPEYVPKVPSNTMSWIYDISPDPFVDNGDFTKDGEKICICQICLQRVTIANRDSHLRIHEVTKLRCEHCDLTFIKIAQLELHMSTCHFDALYAKHNIAALTKDELKSVIDMAFEETLNFEEDPSKTNRCPQCPDFHSENNSTEEYWREHMNQMHLEFFGQKLRELQARYYTTRVGLSKHSEPEQAKAKSVFECICGQRYAQSGGLFNHTRRFRQSCYSKEARNRYNNREANKSICECGIIFYNAKSMQQHKADSCPFNPNKPSIAPPIATVDTSWTTQITTETPNPLEFVQVETGFTDEQRQNQNENFGTNHLQDHFLASLLPLPDVSNHFEEMVIKPEIEIDGHEPTFDFAIEDDNYEEMEIAEGEHNQDQNEEESVLGDPLSFN